MRFREGKGVHTGGEADIVWLYSRSASSKHPLICQFGWIGNKPVEK